MIKIVKFIEINKTVLQMLRYYKKLSKIKKGVGDRQMDGWKEVYWFYGLLTAMNKEIVVIQFKPDLWCSCVLTGAIL
jgi:hypothetical protein